MSLINNNKAAITSLYFHAGLGNIKHMYTLVDKLSPEQQKMVRKNLLELAPEGVLTSDKREALRDRMSVLVAEVHKAQPATKFSNIRDVLPIIFSYLSKREITQAARVNSTFHEPALFALKAKQSWMFHELQQCMRAYHLESVIEVLQLDPENAKLITHLQLSNSDLDDNGVISFLKLCPGLTSLDLGKLLRTISFGGPPNLPTMTNATLAVLGRYCPLLTSIDLSMAINITDEGIEALTKSLPKLSSINLKMCNQLQNGILASLVRNCENLKTIHLSNGSGFTDESLISLFARFRFLEKVDLNCCTIANRNITNAVVNAISQHCRGIQELELSCWPLTDEVVTTLTQSCTKLRVLNLMQCVLITDKSIRAISQNCPNLTGLNIMDCMSLTDISSLKGHIKHLTLRNCQNITDASVIAFSKNCKELENIDITLCSKLTDASIVALCDNCPNLKTIEMQWCVSFTDISIRALLKRPEIVASGNLIATKVWQLRQLPYEAASPLGLVYYKVLTQKHAVKQMKKIICDLLEKADKKLSNLVYAKFPKGSDTWSKANILDLLLAHLSLALPNYIQRLPQDQKNRVYASIYRLAGSPQTDDPRWGEHHAIKNLIRLADALSFTSKEEEKKSDK